MKRIFLLYIFVALAFLGNFFTGPSFIFAAGDVSQARLTITPDRVDVGGKVTFSVSSAPSGVYFCIYNVSAPSSQVCKDASGRDLKIDPSGSGSLPGTMTSAGTFTYGVKLGGFVGTYSDAPNARATVSVGGSQVKPVIKSVLGVDADGNFNPGEAIAGNDLIVRGSSFTQPASSNKVFIGTTQVTGSQFEGEATPTTASLRVKIPATVRAGNHDVSIQNANGKSAGVALAVKAAAGQPGGPPPPADGTECDIYSMSKAPQVGGSKSNASKACIELAQTLLNDKNDAGLTVDGAYGTKTKAAVLKYQEDFGLKCKDGIIGPETWNSLAGTSFTVSGKCGDAAATDDDDSTTGEVTSDLDCASQGLEKDAGLCVPKSPFAKDCAGVACSRSLGDIIKRILTILLTLAGIIAVFFIIIGGYQYMTSAGNEEQAGKGRKTLTNALIGLGVVLLAYTLVTVIYNTLTKGAIF